MGFRKLTTLIIACGLLLVAAGCDKDDIADILNLPNPQDDPAAQAMVAEGAELAKGVLDEIEGWTQDDLGGPPKTEPVWNPDCSCWEWVIEDGDVSDPLDWWTRNWAFAVGYFLGETPQMHLEGADRVHADINFAYSDGRYEDETDNSNRSVYFNVSLDATDFLTGVMNVNGGGGGSLMIFIVDGEDVTEVYEEVTIDVQFTLPLGGCPTGTITFTMGTTVFLITLNGTATASWTFTPDGNADLAFGGTFGLGCGG